MIYLLGNTKRTKPTFSKTINNFMCFSFSLSLEIAEFDDLVIKKLQKKVVSDKI